MNQSLLILVGFVSWTIFLGLLVVGYRAIEVLLGKKKSNEFTAGQKHGTPLYWEMNRAHANALENLPIFAALVLIGNVSGKVDLFFIYGCMLLLGARVLQSVTHLISTSVLAVDVRFTFYLIQVGAFIFLITKLI